MLKLIVLLALVGFTLGAFPKGNITVRKSTLGIVGGTDTDISLHPFQVSLQEDGEHICGGFLISANWIVTAAHCVARLSKLIVRAGSSTTSDGGQLSPVTSFIRHPDYSRATFDNDIALLYLSEPINTTNAAPATLPSAGQVIPDGANAIITGWGATKENGIAASVLQQVQVPIVNLATCRSAYALVRPVTDNMFCAGAFPKGNITVRKSTLGIVGGTDTDISLHPFQVSVQEDGEHICGGILISANWIVTAAHCVSWISALIVRAGSSITSDGGQLSPVTSFIRHPDYSRATFNNDIALLYLSEPINITNAAPATLPSAGQVLPDGANAIITGWGVTEQYGIPPLVLQQVQVPIVNLATCRSAYALVRPVTNNMFCAGEYGTGGKSSCLGDSGGPVVVNGEVVGIVSWAVGCAQPQYPGVYVRVANYRNWIREHTGI